MRVYIVCVCLCVFFVRVEARDWSRITTRAARSLYHIDPEECTAFSIDSARGYLLTANHCASGNVVADGKPAVVVMAIPSIDVLVLQSPIKKPALEQALTPPRAGQEAVALGFYHAGVGPMAFALNITYPNIVIGTAQFLVTSPAFVEGMSGGPVLDSHGHVAGMTQARDQNRTIGFSRGIDAVWQATKQWWAQ